MVTNEMKSKGLFNEESLRISDANLRARVRMSTIYTVANNLNYLVVGSGDEENKLGHVFHLDMRNEVGRLCNDEECDYFKSFVK